MKICIIFVPLFSLYLHLFYVFNIYNYIIEIIYVTLSLKIRAKHNSDYII